MKNSELLKKLLTENKIALEDADFLWQTSPSPLPASTSFDRVEGMLLGLATGDSLGNTTESQNPDQRRYWHGEITDYLPNHDAGHHPVGAPSDDTQMAFWTLEVLLADGRLDPQHLAERFCAEQIYGIGSSVQEFIVNFKSRGKAWHEAGVPSAGNGALMRIAPVLLPHLRAPSIELWADAAIAGMVTHNDRASNAACVAFTSMLWDLLGMNRPPEPHWWLQQYCQIAGPLEGNGTQYEVRRSGFSYQGPMWKFISEQVESAYQQHRPILQACNAWGSGAYLLETIASSLYILMHYGHDPKQAIIRAVNDTRDNDTAAAIVGALVGALHGKEALPVSWRENLLGRTNASNDGQVFRLIKQAKQRFWD